MYTFCLFVIGLALFLTAFNSESVQTPQREKITWSKAIGWTSSIFGDFKSMFFTASDLKKETLKNRPITKSNEEFETSSTPNTTMEKTLTHTSIA